MIEPVRLAVVGCGNISEIYFKNLSQSRAVNVIACADCGFGSFAGADEMDEAVMWAKFEALTEGARLATKRLWG